MFDEKGITFQKMASKRNREDVDDVAGAVTPVTPPPAAATAASSAIYDFVAKYHASMAQLHQQQEEVDGALKAFSDAHRPYDWPDPVSLNVGGVVHATHLATLRKEPGSLLCHLFTYLPPESFGRDHNGRVHLDRDGTSFGYIVNYLRGYPMAVPENMIGRVLEDAIYYRLPGVWAQLGLAKGIKWRFCGSPGISATKLRYSGSSALVLCERVPSDTKVVASASGPDWLQDGRFSITLRCERAEGLSLGIVTPLFQSEQYDVTSVSTGCAMYNTSGAVTSSLAPGVRDPNIGPRIHDGDLVTMILTLRGGSRRLEWLRNGEMLRVVPIDVVRKAQFVVGTREKSRVSIVDPVALWGECNDDAGRMMSETDDGGGDADEDDEETEEDE
eukprot:PhM_4_TR3390/c0_g1_i1/m.33787/K21918/KCTD8_12_16; BTB/POZ domain-containing protein KCTD8/12/16